MESNTNISDAESAVMEVLWDRSPQSADDVIAALAATRQWQAATVKTLLNRLLKKGAIAAEKEGRRYLYTPAVSREQWLRDASDTFLDRMFAGRLAPLVAHFSRHRKLKPADIAELKRIIADLDDGQ